MSEQAKMKSGDVSRAFWQGTTQGAFLLQRDAATGRSQFYPRAVNIFGEGPMDMQPASGCGELIAVTTVRTPTPGFESPYVVGIVKLNEGPRVFARVVNAPEDLAPGRRMKIAWQSGDADHRLFAFEPI
jgi:uncharacterized OB-fold protein